MATLSGNKIKDTYQSLIKLTDNGNLTTGAKQLTDGFGNNSPLYISTTQIGIGVTPEATYDLHVYSNAKVGGNLTVTGDLTVNGTTTTVDTDTLRVEDPLIELARLNTSADSVDIGFYGKYHPSGTTLYSGLFRDAGDDKYKLFKSLQEEPTTTVNTSGTGYTVATLVADVEGTLTGIIASSTTATTQSANDNSTKVATTAYVDTSAGNYLPLAGGTMSGNIAMGGNNISGGGTATFTSFVGDLTGNADTATALETARTIQVSGDIAGSASFDGTADINISTTIQPNSVALGTDTTGNYVATISGTANEITVSGSGSESAAVTISLPSSISVDVIGDLTGDVYNADGSIILNTGDNTIDAVLSNGVRATTQSQGDNSTKLATTAYVDSAIGGQDTLAEVLANGNTTGGTDISVSSGDDITFADSSKSIYGAGSDLQIYHDGSNSYISTISGGDLYVQSTNDDVFIRTTANDKDIFIQSDDGSGGVATYFQADGSTGAVKLYHYGTKKFETTSTGVTVTGGLSTTNSITLSNPTDKYIRFIDTYGNWQIEVGDGANNFKIHSQSLAADYLTLEGGGQLNLGEYGSGSFTGTATYRLAVDSSGDVIEIPIGDGAVDGSGTANYVTKWSDTDTITNSVIYDDGTNVGIGTTSLTNSSGYNTLSISGTTGAQISFQTSGVGKHYIYSTATDFHIYNSQAGNLKLYTNSTERMRIDSSGNVNIGNGIAEEKRLIIDCSNPVFALKETDQSADSRVWGMQSIASKLYFRAFNDALSAATDVMVLDRSGNVGIGTTTNISSPLTVQTDGSANSISIIGRDNGTSDEAIISFYEYDGTTRNSYIIKQGGDLAIATGTGGSPSESMRIDSSGKVGVSNTNPSAFNSLGATAQIVIGTSSNFVSNLTTFSGASGYGSIAFADSDSSSSSSQYSGLIQYYHADDSMTLYTSAQPRMRIDSSGQIKTQNRNFAKESNYGYSSSYKALVLGSTGTNTSTNSTTVSINYDPSGNAYSGFSGDGREVLFRRGVQFVTPNSADDSMYLYNLVLKDGQVGIGTASPSEKLTIDGTASGAYVRISNAGSGDISSGYMIYNGSNLDYFVYTNPTFGNTTLLTREALAIRAGGSERMRITSAGAVGIGTTSPSAPLQVHGQQKWYTTNADGNELRGFFNPGGAADDAELYLYKADGATQGVAWRGEGDSYIRVDSTSLQLINFYYGTVDVGQIVTTGSAVLYQSNSDYRLKENVVEMTGALDRVSQLKPSRFNFISHPDNTVDGFLAHELQQIVPQAVTGEKDATKEDGTPKYQGVDHSQIVPLLVGAIQELKAEIETLKAQINN